MIRLLTSLLLVTLSSASFCGDSAIPYSLEVLPDGQPMLGCARPTCFGWGPDGKPATDTAAFHKINDQPDGFIRSDRDAIPAYGSDDPRYYRPHTALCEHSFSSSNCSENQWVGGIAPLNATSFPTVLQCCDFDALHQSEDRGLASLRIGEIVVGGEVVSEGIQAGFDYISNIVKVLRRDGSLQYDVSVRRMPCTDLQSPADFYKFNKPEGGAARAFQAPNVPVDQPLPLPSTGAASQNGVLEELVQQQAVQLPPGTQFQQSLQPAPFQQVPYQSPQYVPQPAAPQYYPASYYGGVGSHLCFTDDMRVTLPDGSTKRMDELTKNDMVLSVDDDKLKYVPIEFWLHRVPAQEAEFNEFETENGNTIKLTDKHYIFKGDCSRVGAGPVPIASLSQTAVTADQVHAGDCLYTLVEGKEMHEVRVVRTSKVIQTGIYAPMTSNGRIIVNGVHASCHNIMQEHSMGHTFFRHFHILNAIYDSLFGSDSEEIIETPAGLSTILDIAGLVVPKNLVAM